MADPIVITGLTQDQVTDITEVHSGRKVEVIPEPGGLFTVKISFQAATSAPAPAPVIMPTNVAAIPTGDPVPFAALATPISNKLWPVITSDLQAMVVCHQTTSGSIVGGNARHFFANRSDGARHHVGVDVFCREGDVVVACADGKIVNFYPFYKRPTTGEVTFALFIAHDGVVINYGEVRANAQDEFKWSLGSTVVAGQKIARVSGTAMIHFETYVPGTEKNHSWLAGDPRPDRLLNPTKLLMSLVAGGNRIRTDGAQIVAAGTAGTAAASFSASFRGPRPGSATWHRRFNGQEWRYDQRGVYLRGASDDGQLLRTVGEPITAREIFRLYSRDILAAATKHSVNPALIMMTIATETAFARDQQFTGPKTFRWEAQVDNTDVSPSFAGSYSAGPMQCLATTTRELLVKFGTSFGMTQQPFTVAPALNPQPLPAPAAHPLYEAGTNIDIGSAEIRMRFDGTGDDPILVASAFNAGSLREDAASPWGLHAHGDHLDRAARWYGDACEVLSQQGIV
jgi:murein DD-endopeptidase MepM/ murein hydrolase activator NlpD